MKATAGEVYTVYNQYLKRYTPPARWPILRRRTR